MKSGISKLRASKESTRITTNTIESVQGSRLNSSKQESRAKLPSNNKRSLKRLTLNMFNKENDKDRQRKQARLTTSKDRSIIPSYMATPARELTLLMTSNTATHQELSKSATNLLSVSRLKRPRPSTRSCQVHLHYGETVLSHSFDVSVRIGEVHLHFFR